MAAAAVYETHICMYQELKMCCVPIEHTDREIYKMISSLNPVYILSSSLSFTCTCTSTHFLRGISHRFLHRQNITARSSCVWSVGPLCEWYIWTCVWNIWTCVCNAWILPVHWGDVWWYQCACSSVFECATLFDDDDMMSFICLLPTENWTHPFISFSDT